MKRFRFRLDRLLNLRETAEQERARRLNEVARAAEEIERVARESAARRATAQQQVARSRAGSAAAGTLAVLGRALHAIQARARTDDATRREADARVEAERQKYSEARQQRRSLERLRAMRYAQWCEEVARAEQRETDEVAARVVRQGKRGSS